MTLCEIFFFLLWFLKHNYYSLDCKMKNKSELFYETMKYPKPSDELLKFFEFSELNSNSTLHHYPELCDLFSRKEKQSQIMSDYITFCNTYWTIWRSIPFIEQVYLANSITFNALHEWSDIDVLIIVRPWKIRIVRLFTWIFLFFNNILRVWNRIEKKICTSFFVDNKHLNFYSLLLQPLDIYFIFWLAHLVPRYTLQWKESDKIWKHNKWLKSYLQFHPLEQVIRLQNQLFFWTTWPRDIIERILWWSLGSLCNWIISVLWRPIMLWKKKKLGKVGWGIVISDSMLKFHGDKRKEIALKYKGKCNAYHNEILQ